MTADDGDGDRRPLRSSDAGPEGRGQQAGNDGQRGHQNGPQANHVALENRLTQRIAALAKLVHVVDLQNPVLLDDA